MHSSETSTAKRSAELRRVHHSADWCRAAQSSAEQRRAAQSSAEQSRAAQRLEHANFTLQKRYGSSGGQRRHKYLCSGRATLHRCVLAGCTLPSFILRGVCGGNRRGGAGSGGAGNASRSGGRRGGGRGIGSGRGGGGRSLERATPKSRPQGRRPLGRPPKYKVWDKATGAYLPLPVTQENRMVTAAGGPAVLPGVELRE